MRLAALASLTLAALVALGACASAPPTGTAAGLPGTSWTLERIVYPTGEVVRGGGERLTFGLDGRVGLSSCNQCGGRYRAQASSLTLDANLACTLRGCPEGAIELERFVRGTMRMERDGPYLLLQEAEPGEEAPQLLFLPGGDEGAAR